MIDLHLHSIFSDGTDTPEAIVLAASELGLKAIALTDHDTLGGLERFMAMQSSVATTLIPGVELSCSFMGKTLHILGLYLNFLNQQLIRELNHIHAQRVERNKLMLKRLVAIGVPITWEDIVLKLPNSSITRMHFAKALLRCGIVASLQEAFTRFIGDNNPCFVPVADFKPEDAITLITKAGGIPVIAHPGRGFPNGFCWDEAMLKLKNMGVQGLEAYHSSYGTLEQNYFLRLATDLDLVPCGGSDYHGSNKHGVSLGTGKGNLHVPDVTLKLLQNLHQKNLAS